MNFVFKECNLDCFLFILIIKIMFCYKSQIPTDSHIESGLPVVPKVSVFES